jgi:Heavy metal binding domain
MNKTTSASGETNSSGADVYPASAPEGAGRRAGVVLAARLGILLGAVLAFALAVHLARAHDRASGNAEALSTERYTCPMHPEVVSRLPGECPICRMALERVSGVEKHPMTMAKDGVVGVVKRQVVTQTVRAPAWSGSDGTLKAVVYQDDLAGLAPGQRALFFNNATPGTAMTIRRTDDAPVPWDEATVQVTFRFEHPEAGADRGWVEIAAMPRSFLVVPTSAVLYSGTGAYVLAAGPAGGSTFTRRSVEVGRILDSGYGAGLVDDRYGAIVVRSGLEAGERVVIEDTFFMDAERRLQAAQGNAAEVKL